MELSLINNKFIRFLFVGVINTIFGYSLYALFLKLGFHYSIAVLASTVIGIIFNFFTTGRLVFQNTRNSLIFKFFGVYGIIYFTNVFLLKIFDLYSFNLYLAGAVLILPMALLSFVLNKNLVFEGKND